MTGHSPARRDARLAAEEVIAFARRRGLTARTTRRLLREAAANSAASASTWHAAACDAAGCLLLDIEDFRQPDLLPRGPRRRRTRSPRKASQ